MEMKRKLRSYRGAVVDRVGDGTSAAGLEVVAQEERSKKSKTEKKRKSRRLERRVGSVDRVGEEVVTLSEDVENKETRNRKEETEDLENVAASSGITAVTESRHTSKQSMRSGSFKRHYDPKKVWVRGLPQDITDEGIRNYFAKCGEISGMYCSGAFLYSNNFKRCLIFTGGISDRRGAKQAGSWTLPGALSCMRVFKNGRNDAIASEHRLESGSDPLAPAPPFLFLHVTMLECRPPSQSRKCMMPRKSALPEVS